MIIHLIASMRKFDEDLVALQAIDKVVQAHGATIALPWYAAVSDRQVRGTIPEGSLDWPTIVNHNLDAAKNSDALIIEGSRFNYSQAYQTAVALQYKKPVLTLYRKDVPEYTDWPDKFFMSGVSDPLFQAISYGTIDEVEGIVTKFLDGITPSTKDLDMKLALDIKVYNQLEALAKKNHQSLNAAIKTTLTDAFNR